VKTLIAVLMVVVVGCAGCGGTESCSPPETYTDETCTPGTVRCNCGMQQTCTAQAMLDGAPLTTYWFATEYVPRIDRTSGTVYTSRVCEGTGAP
jgi:hypothetical protein